MSHKFPQITCAYYSPVENQSGIIPSAKKGLLLVPKAWMIIVVHIVIEEEVPDIIRRMWGSQVSGLESKLNKILKFTVRFAKL